MEQTTAPDARLRCGDLMDVCELNQISPTGTRHTPNAYHLVLHMREAELSGLTSGTRRLSAGLSLICSPAEVMYAVVSLQRRSVQWRLVVPLWSERARAWLEDALAHQCVSMAAGLSSRAQVCMVRWQLQIPAPEMLLGLASSWPELADPDKLMDLSMVLNRLAEPAAMVSVDPSCKVAQALLVTHCAWLHKYLLSADLSKDALAEDMRAYTDLVH